MNYNEMVNFLIDEYRRLHKDNAPDWRRKPYWIVPTIPFIGEKYSQSSPRMIVYASTEYLNSHVPGENQDWDNLLKSYNRHRDSFEKWKNQKKTFFPNIHMQPVTDGGLICATSYYLYKKYGIKYQQPDELIEHIAIANVCKYTDVDSYDYCPQNVSKRNYSIPLFELDLRTLNPEIIIIPRTIARHPSISDVIDTVCPNIKDVIQVNQFASRSVNQLTEYGDKGVSILNELKKKHSHLSEWIEKIEKYSINQVYCYLAHI